MAMRIRKYHPHRSVLFVTLSIEEGLLLLANPLCEALIKSCLASAQELYPVTICHHLIQATHGHFLLVVDNPEDVKDFIRHFKTESAHLLNNLLGRQKRTIWCEGYDSPVVLTLERAMSTIAYIYTNPVKDELVETIDLFPGVSSWKMFLKGEHTKRWKRLRRPAVRTLLHHSPRAYVQESERLLREARTMHTFRIEPNAWLSAFGITDPEEQAEKNRQLIEMIRAREDAAERAREGRPVLGREALMTRVIDLSYRPERSGRRMACLCEDRSLRSQFIEMLKGLYTLAKEVSERWRRGDISVPFPPGLYPPSFPKLIEPLCAW